VVKWVATLKEKDSHPSGMGIEFVDFDEKVKAKLESLVKAYENR
jgi:hypothetical protein